MAPLHPRLRGVKQGKPHLPELNLLLELADKPTNTYSYWLDSGRRVFLCFALNQYPLLWWCHMSGLAERGWINSPSRSDTIVPESFVPLPTHDYVVIIVKKSSFSCSITQLWQIIRLAWQLLTMHLLLLYYCIKILQILGNMWSFIPFTTNHQLFFLSAKGQRFNNFFIW